MKPDRVTEPSPSARRGITQGRRAFLKRTLAAGGALLAVGRPKWGAIFAADTAPVKRPGPNWYEEAFYLLHLDHHTGPQQAVGAEADPAQVGRLLALSKPDVIQIHAKGNPGWTTYPSAIGHTPPKLARDVLAVWRDAARSRGYAWSIYYNFGRDGELMKRRPAWNRVDAAGRPRDRALCYHSGVVESYIWPMLEELLQHYDADAFWFDGSAFTVATCYCAKCRERFRRETGYEPPRSPAAPGWDAFKEMHRRIYREAIAATVAWVRQRRPACRVAFNWAFSLHMPEEPLPGIGHLTGDTANHVEVLSLEAHWLDSQPVPFDLMTTVYASGPQGNIRPKPRGQMEQEMAVIIANGGRYHAWDNPTPQSGLVPERQEFLGQVVAPFLRSRQAWCLGSVRVPAVSALFTSTHHYAATRSNARCFIDAANASPALRGVAEVLQCAHLDYELISRERLLRRQIATPYLLAEDLAAVNPDEAAALRQFVEGGGTLLLTGGGMRHADLPQLAGFQDVSAKPAAVSWRARLEAGVVRVDLPLYAALVAPDGGAEILLEAAGDASVRHPLVVRRQVGRGVVLTALVPAFSTMSVPKEEQDGRQELREFLLQALVSDEQRLLTTTGPAEVELVLRRRERSFVLHLVNRASGRSEVSGSRGGPRITDIPPAPVCEVTLRLPERPEAVVLVPQHDVLSEWTWTRGRVRLGVPAFSIHQMVEFRMPKGPLAISKVERRGLEHIP